MFTDLWRVSALAREAGTSRLGSVGIQVHRTTTPVRSSSTREDRSESRVDGTRLSRRLLRHTCHTYAKRESGRKRSRRRRRHSDNATRRNSKSRQPLSFVARRNGSRNGASAIRRCNTAARSSLCFGTDTRLRVFQLLFCYSAEKETLRRAKERTRENGSHVTRRIANTRARTIGGCIHSDARRTALKFDTYRSLSRDR